MSRDLRPGPDSPPVDELESAEATLAVLQHVVHTIATDDLTRRTPCSDYDVKQLTEHVVKSIEALGGMAGAEMPGSDGTDSVERQIIGAARPAVDAWHRRGLEGKVPFGGAEMPAKTACGVLSLEFLVHAWDYAAALGHDIHIPESLIEYVLELAHNIIRPEIRGAGFADPVRVSEGASALDRLLAFTGRNPAG